MRLVEKRTAFRSQPSPIVKFQNDSTLLRTHTHFLEKNGWRKNQAAERHERNEPVPDDGGDETIKRCVGVDSRRIITVVGKHNIKESFCTDLNIV